MDNKPQFQLEAFEGPLDLLLNLIQKNKVSIYDIPIAMILEQYMEILTEAERANLDISSEFLVVAATLLNIKSKMLLPKQQKEEEQEDPRDELSRMLAEYQRIKIAAEFLQLRVGFNDGKYFKLRDYIEPPQIPFNTANLTLKKLASALVDAYQKLERRTPPPVSAFRGIGRKVSVRERALHLWQRLIKTGKSLFRDIFKGSKSRSEVVASFLAVLEMVKINAVKLDDDNTSIHVLNNSFDFNIAENYDTQEDIQADHPK